MSSRVLRVWLCTLHGELCSVVRFAPLSSLQALESLNFSSMTQYNSASRSSHPKSIKKLFRMGFARWVCYMAGRYKPRMTCSPCQLRKMDTKNDHTGSTDSINKVRKAMQFCRPTPKFGELGQAMSDPLSRHSRSWQCECLAR